MFPFAVTKLSGVEVRDKLILRADTKGFGVRIILNTLYTNDSICFAFSRS